MGDPEKQETTAAQSDPAPTDKSDGGAAGGDIGLTMSYITSIPGILKIVEFFTLMLAFALAADTSYRWSRMEFFLFVTIFSWILVIAVFLLFAFNVVSKINLSIDWNMPQLQCWIQLGSRQEEPWQTVSAPTPRLSSAMAGPLPKEASQELVLAGT
ncbi:hypothetical protein ACROYT_G013520 [Oculina patagonica]